MLSNKVKTLFNKLLKTSPEQDIGEVQGFRISKGYLEQYQNNEWEAVEDEVFLKVLT